MSYLSLGREKHYSYFLSYVIAEKIYEVLPANLRVFIDGKARRIRYTRLSNQNQASNIRR